jgi:hypothetical protein
MAGSASRANGAKGGRPRKDGTRAGSSTPTASNASRAGGKSDASPQLAAALQAYQQLELARAAGDTAKMQQALAAIGQALKSAPKPTAPPRVTFPGIPHAKKRAFLVAYSECATVTEAAQIAGIDRKTHNNWLKADSDYKDAFETVAKEAAGDRLEKEAWRRAVDGWEEPVFHQGRQVSTIRKFDSTLLIFLLKGTRPEKFRDRFEHSGPGGTPLPSGTSTILYMPSNGRNQAAAPA